MGQKVYPGRYAASPPDGTVVFLIGMRINKWWKIHRWLPAFISMVPMLKEVNRRSEHGFLGYHVWFGRTTIVLQYWKNLDDLLTYARNADAEHVPGWRNFNRQVGNNGDVGVWHEAYVTHPDQMHIIYRNMPEFGMGKATNHVHSGGNGPVTVRKKPDRAAGSNESR